MADDVLGQSDATFDVQLYGLSAVVYAERNGLILLPEAGSGRTAVIASNSRIEASWLLARWS